MTAVEILKMEYGDSKHFMTSHVLGRGSLGEYAAYELASGAGMTCNTMLGISVVAYLPEFGITRRLTNLSRVFAYPDLASRYTQSLRKNPSIIEQEINRFDEWLCPHGINRWHHPECWLWYQTGDEKYKVLVDKLTGDNFEAGSWL